MSTPGGRGTDDEAGTPGPANVDPEPPAPPAAEPGPPGRVRYWLVTGFLWLAVRVYLRLRVEGLEKLPDGPAMLCFNHQSWADPFVLVAALPARLSIVYRRRGSVDQPARGGRRGVPRVGVMGEVLVQSGSGRGFGHRVAHVVRDRLAGAVVSAVPHPLRQVRHRGSGRVVDHRRGLRDRIRHHIEDTWPVPQCRLDDGLGTGPVNA